MAPVYFPFTYVAPTAAALLEACFRRTAVYQPLSETASPDLKDGAASGRFDLRIPVNTDGNRLLALLDEFQAWAGLHEGKDLKSFTTRGGRVPFFDDTAAHRLSADIRQRAAGTTAAAASTDPLFDARVFLALAQEFDRRQGDVQRGLAAYREMEQKLIQDLIGEPETPQLGLGGGPALWTEEPGGHMTEKRLEAFARLAREDAADDRIFVTTSRAAFEAVIERIGASKEVLRIAWMPVPEPAAREAFRNELTAHLASLLADPAASPETVDFNRSEGEARRLSLTFHRAEIDRTAFLDALSAPVPPTETPGEPGKEAILIGILEGAA